MGRPGPKKTQEYGVEFKRAAVQLSHRPGIQVKQSPMRSTSTRSCFRDGGRSSGKDASDRGHPNRNRGFARCHVSARSSDCRSWSASIDFFRRSTPS